MARILIVDDYADIRLVLAAALEDEHTVITATDGEDGLATFLAQPIDLVLTDMSMPKMTGPELITAIHQHAPLTPIIGMTAGLHPSLIPMEQDRLGIQGFFSKPMELHDLRRTIAEVLRTHATVVDSAA